jgi:hypothetical protein
MKRALMLLCATVLVGTAVLVPGASATSACTCSSEAAACRDYCLSINCQKSHLTCNLSDPCNSACACSFCIP